MIFDNVFPVYAGVILTDNLPPSGVSGVPRVCGGDPITVFLNGVDRLVFPVYAGVIPV